MTGIADVYVTTANHIACTRDNADNDLVDEGSRLFSIIRMAAT